MTACPGQRPAGFNLKMAFNPSPTQVLAGGGVTFLLGLCFFAVVWLHQEHLFKACPLLAIPFLATMVLGPTLLFTSIRRMTETGLGRRLLLSAFLSAMSMVLVTLTFVLSLRHLAGPIGSN